MVWPNGEEGRNVVGLEGRLGVQQLRRFLCYHKCGLAVHWPNALVVGQRIRQKTDLKTIDLLVADVNNGIKQAREGVIGVCEMFDKCIHGLHSLSGVRAESGELQRPC